MNWDQVEGKWRQMKGQIQSQWSRLTDDDIGHIQGRRTELVGRIQEHYGIEKAEAERQVDNWLARN